jgi:hypothetical protein
MSKTKDWYMEENWREPELDEYVDWKNIISW